MTLLITLLAAIVVTLIWYQSKGAREMKVGLLCYMFWGAGLMWLCDAVAEYSRSGIEYFHPPIQQLVNDAFLGTCEIAFALVIWLCVLLLKDPKRVLKKANSKTNS